jgi:hypothetical protein
MLLLQISTKPRDGSPRERRRDKKNTTQRLLFLFLLFINHRKNLQTKISPNAGFFGTHSFYSQGGKKSSER